MLIVFLTFTQFGQGQNFDTIDPGMLDRFLTIESPDSSQTQEFKITYDRFLDLDIGRTIQWSDSIYRAMLNYQLTIDEKFTHIMGESLDSLSQFALADKFFQSSLEQLAKTGTAEALLAVMFRYSLNLYHQSRFSDALTLFDQMLEIAGAEGLEKYQARAHYGIGNVYYGLTEYDQAIGALNKSVKICAKKQMNALMALNYKTLGNCYHLLADPARAISYHRKALSLQDSSQHAWTYVELSNDYSWDRKYRDSVWYFAVKAIANAKQFNNNFMKLMAYKNLMSLSYQERKLDSCIQYSDSALQLAKKNHDISSIAEIYKLLSNVYYHKEDHKLALRYYHTYFLYYDSLMVQNANFGYSLNRYLLNSALRNKEISDLSTKTKEQGSIIKRTQTLLVVVVLLLVGAIVSVYIIRLLNQKRISELKHKLTRFQMNPHFIFNSLNSLQTFVLENDVKSANNYLSMFSKLMRLTLENSYHNDVPVSQERHQLELYLQLESMRFDHQFSYAIHVNPDVDENHTRIPSLLIQPFVENAIWHGLLNKPGGDKMLQINITKEGDKIVCSVEDNGIGRNRALEIKAGNKSSYKSLGTKITQQRLELLSAIHGKNFRISYEDLFNKFGNPQGTRVNIYLPMVLN